MNLRHGRTLQHSRKNRPATSRGGGTPARYGFLTIATQDQMAEL